MEKERELRVEDRRRTGSWAHVSDHMTFHARIQSALVGLSGVPLQTALLSLSASRPSLVLFPCVLPCSITPKGVSPLTAKSSATYVLCLNTRSRQRRHYCQSQHIEANAPVSRDYRARTTSPPYIKMQRPKRPYTNKKVTRRTIRILPARDSVPTLFMMTSLRCRYQRGSSTQRQVI